MFAIATRLAVRTGIFSDPNSNLNDGDATNDDDVTVDEEFVSLGPRRRSSIARARRRYMQSLRNNPSSVNRVLNFDLTVVDEDSNANVDSPPPPRKIVVVADETQCSICLCSLNPDNGGAAMGVVAACAGKHCFHVDCFDELVAHHHRRCPMCRGPLHSNC